VFALIAVSILLLGCTAQPPLPEQQKTPWQEPVSPPVQEPKITGQPPAPAAGQEPQETPLPAVQPLTPEQQPPQPNQANATAAPAEFNPALAGSPHPKVKQPSYPPCCSHPYYHEVYRAFSSDGVSWQKEGTLVKDKASVPAILQKDDGTFILYYVDGEYDTIDCSVSQDGKAFSPGNCTIYGFTEQKAWDPYVVNLGNGSYKMYYFTPPSDLFGESKNQIRSAISKDGIKWLQEDGVRFEYNGILDPVVIKMEDTWRMYAWYMGKGNEPGNSVMVSATSQNGLDFAFEKEFNVGGGIPEVVKLDSGKYALYVCSGGITMFTSADGLSWSGGKVVVSPAQSEKIVCDPTVIKMDSGRWAMYYKTQG